jgi:hypothetical protein
MGLTVAATAFRVGSSKYCPLATGQYACTTMEFYTKHQRLLYSQRMPTYLLAVLDNVALLAKGMQLDLVISLNLATSRDDPCSSALPG